MIKPSRQFCLALIGLAAGASLAPARAQPPASSAPAYPAARISDQVDRYGGQDVADPYRWLELLDASETRAWAAAQNALVATYMGGLTDRAAIRTRLSAAARAAQLTAPRKGGSRFFQLERRGSQDETALYVSDSRDGPARVLLDPNGAAGGAALRAFEPSPNGRLVSYTITRLDADREEIRVRDVASGQDLADTLRNTYESSISWTRDNRGFFYVETVAAPAGRTPTTVEVVRYHRLGTPAASDIRILGGIDRPTWRYRVQLSTNGEYAVIDISDGADPRNGVYMVDLGVTQSSVDAPLFRLFEPGEARFTYVHNIETDFFFLTDAEAPRHRIVAVDIDLPGAETWRAVVREGARVLVGAKAVGTKLVLTYLDADAGEEVLTLTSLTGAPGGAITLPGHGTVLEVTGSLDDEEMFYTYTSFTAPPTVYRYDFRRAVSSVYHAPEFDTSAYETRHEFAQQTDGTRIPVYITARKGLPTGVPAPTILTTGGGFDTVVTPVFSPDAIAWMDMGGVYAVAVVRGGGEYGALWRDAGIRERRATAVDDYVVVAAHLVLQQVTSPQKLVALARGHGAAIAAAAMLQLPKEFAGAVFSNGVFDLLRAPTLPAGWAWSSEYGSLADTAQAAALVDVSPLARIRAGSEYPAVLITAGERDGTISPAHALKFGAALQAAQRGPGPILLRVSDQTRGSRETRLSRLLDETADALAFAARQVGARM